MIYKITLSIIFSLFFLPVIHFLIFLLSRVKKGNLPFYILHFDIYRKLFFKKEEIGTEKILKFLPLIILNFIATLVVSGFLFYFILGNFIPFSETFAILIMSSYLIDFLILCQDTTNPGALVYMKDRAFVFFVTFLFFIIAKFFYFNYFFFFFTLLVLFVFQSPWRMRESLLFSNLSGKTLLIFFHSLAEKELLLYLLVNNLFFHQGFLSIVISAGLVMLYELIQIFLPRVYNYRKKLILTLTLLIMGIIV